MTDTTGPEMRRAVEAAREWLAGCDPTDGHLASDMLARALLAANAEAERMRAVAQCIEHDIAIVTQHRNARQSGGQHVGTGGPLGAASPSMLAYLERVVRDMRRSAPDAGASGEIEREEQGR